MSAQPRWYDDMPELGEVPPLTADDLHRIALRQTYSLGHWLDRDDEAAYEESREWCAHHCPECFGSGLDVVYHSALRDWETGEFVDTEEVPCVACHGTGELTTPLDEADVARTDHLLAESVQLDLQGLEQWVESRDRSDPFCVEVGE